MTRVIKPVALVLTFTLIFMVVVSALVLAQRNSFFEAGYALATPADRGSSPSMTLVAGSEAAFNVLSQQRTNACGLQPDRLLSYADDMRLQGSCCSPMDLHRYQEQVAELRRYAGIAQIPQDAYDVPVALAQELLGYQTDIQLTSDQQAIYDRAVELSELGGPCCCRCWRWYAFEGMGKYLIVEQDWTSEQLAELWTLTDGCGGAGHEHA